MAKFDHVCLSAFLVQSYAISGSCSLVLKAAFTWIQADGKPDVILVDDGR